MRCDWATLGELSGPGADAYARQHLVRIGSGEGGWEIYYRCPATGLKFVLDYPQSDYHRPHTRSHWSPSSPAAEGRMRRAYLVLSLGIIALGAVHIAATPRYFPELSAAAVWFASGGLAMILTGALNLLRRAYGALAPGLRAVCVGANVAMAGFALLAGYASRATALELALVLGLLGGTTVLSLLPAAQRPVTAAPRAA